MKFTDYANFKDNDEIKRYTIKVNVNRDIYSKLKKNGPSRSFQYLMLKHFNVTMLKRAYEYYLSKNFILEKYDDDEEIEYFSVAGLFKKAEFEQFENVVKIIQSFGVKRNKINFAAKLIVYYLFDTGIIGCTQNNDDNNNNGNDGEKEKTKSTNDKTSDCSSTSGKRKRKTKKTVTKRKKPVSKTKENKNSTDEVNNISIEININLEV